MSTGTLFSAFLIFFPAVRSAFNDTVFEPIAVFIREAAALPIVKITETTVYVPMGRHAVLECAAFSSAQTNSGNVMRQKVWVFHDVHEHRWITINQSNSRFSHRTLDGRLILYTAQKENEGIYDCHVMISSRLEWVSRINLYVQDCDNDQELTAYRNLMNPCRYGGCTLAKFPSAPLLKYLKCNCVLQYTGEYCTELVRGTVRREILRFSPFIAHICSTLCIFIVFFCCRRTERRKRIVSLEDVVPPPPDKPDDPKDLYPAAMLPAVTGDEPFQDADLNAETIAACLRDLKNNTM